MKFSIHLSPTTFVPAASSQNRIGAVQSVHLLYRPLESLPSKATLRVSDRRVFFCDFAHCQKLAYGGTTSIE